jgi:hypothetical protein
MINLGEIMIDNAGRIIRCSDVWDRVMRSRRLRHLTSSQISGKELGSFIPTSTHRQIADGIAMSIRDQPQTVQLYCQVPDSRELLLLEVGPAPTQDGNGSIRIEIEHLDRSNAGQDRAEIRLINMCSHCRRIRVNEHWVDVLEAAQALHLLCLDPPPPISHGLCSNCFDPPAGELD